MRHTFKIHTLCKDFVFYPLYTGWKRYYHQTLTCIKSSFLNGCYTCWERCSWFEVFHVETGGLRFQTWTRHYLHTLIKNGFHTHQKNCYSSDQSELQINCWSDQLLQLHLSSPTAGFCCCVSLLEVLVLFAETEGFSSAAGPLRCTSSLRVAATRWSAARSHTPRPFNDYYCYLHSSILIFVFVFIMIFFYSIVFFYLIAFLFLSEDLFVSSLSPLRSQRWRLLDWTL